MQLLDLSNCNRICSSCEHSDSDLNYKAISQVMRALQQTREYAEQEKLLALMNRIEREPNISQRALASELGIALGLMNTYLKRCVKKGWIKATHISGKRLAYFVTREGVVEKSKVVSGYLSKSLTLFRNAKKQYDSFFSICTEAGWIKVAIIGEGDLTDIALLVGKTAGLDLDKRSVEDDLGAYDAVLITDIQDPQSVYEKIRIRVEDDRLLVLDLLQISKRNVS
jgi:hypothetical protein